MDDKLPKTYKIPSYLCVEKYDYVWVCLDRETLQPIPEISAVSDPDFWTIHEFYET